jgi:hypothetical protein
MDHMLEVAKMKLGKAEALGPGDRRNSCRHLRRLAKRISHKAWRRIGKRFLDDAPADPLRGYFY